MSNATPIQGHYDTSSVFVAVIGRPNVGKSSLTNLLVGEKVAIVTSKPQTTRTRITGVITRGPLQYVLLDTPGVLWPKFEDPVVGEHLAFTGAVSQSGQIMAVGGVTRKIEGFFELCSRRGLTGDQGVILPRDNVEHLMLDEKVVNAVREGRFAIYPVTHISEAMELLTGMPAGRRRKDGTFPKDTLFCRVDERLSEFGWLAEHSFKKPRLMPCGRVRPDFA